MDALINMRRFNSVVLTMPDKGDLRMGLHDTSKAIHLSYSFIRKRMVHLNLQLLYQCNFQCTICDFWKDPYRTLPSMSLSQVESLSHVIEPLGPIVVSIGGGEPLMHRDIIGITHALARKNYPVMICNGWFVTPELSRELFKSGMREISISVDYADAGRHDAQRGKPGAYDRALNALQALIDNRIRSEQRVHMISVVMDDNLDEIEKLIGISKEIGVTYLITFYSSCRGTKNAKASRKDISRHLLSLKKKYPDFIALSEFIHRYSEAQIGGGISPCYAGKNLFNIDCSGNVTRCIDRLDDVAGNIFNDDLPSIMKNLRVQTAHNDCGACWTSCRGNIETILYGRRKLRSLIEYWNIVKNVPLRKSADA
jgi:MoaA/NifB/PqqE/SkfB family radical SAM enzyme